MKKYKISLSKLIKVPLTTTLVLIITSCVTRLDTAINQRDCLETADEINLIRNDIADNNLKDISYYYLDRKKYVAYFCVREELYPNSDERAIALHEKMKKIR